MTEHVKTVTVVALKDHTNNGTAYTAGDTYDVPESEVANLVAQDMAKPTHDAPHGKAKGSHPVTPMGTGDFPTKT